MSTKIQIQPFMQRIGLHTQTELAEALGLTQAAVSAWNSGTRTPPYETCAKLLSMGMTLEELFGEEIAKKVFQQKEPSWQNGTDADFLAKVKSALIQIASQ